VACDQCKTVLTIPAVLIRNPMRLRETVVHCSRCCCLYPRPNFLLRQCTVPYCTTDVTFLLLELMCVCLDMGAARLLRDHSAGRMSFPLLLGQPGYSWQDSWDIVGVRHDTRG
jgi:hypothetical protein